MNKILFIRRDNIGDLICTTPAIRAVRNKFPLAKVGILVNTYNAEVIINNPDVDEVYIYEKAKHAPDKSKFSVWWNNFRILKKIRKERYDVAIGCGSYSPRLARYTYYTGAKKRIGYLRKEMGTSKYYNMPLYETEDNLHEVERTCNLLSPLGIKDIEMSLRVFPSQEEVQNVKNFSGSSRFKIEKPAIAFHISSRRSENRWPVDKFIELGRLIMDKYKSPILLLWSPGSEKNVYHPGDDENAEKIINALGTSVIPYKTTRLSQLVAALSVAGIVVCCDGGAMHIAAGLGKPIVTIWGSTNPDRWKPYGVKHILLQDETKKAENINVKTVFEAVEKLLV